MTRHFFSLMALAILSACATKSPEPAIERTNEVSLGFERVPRRPDVAAYPANPEHVIAVQPQGRDFIVVRVTNYPKQRLLPPPVFTPAPATTPSAAAPAKPPAAPAPQVVEFKVHFASGSHALDAEARRAIEAQVNAKNAQDVSAVRIDGHTDSVGSDASNQSLSERRSRAVRDYLVKRGLNASTIVAVGHGESQPVTSNETSSGRAKNRRADVQLSSEAR